jgi:hypothetical protein
MESNPEQRSLDWFRQRLGVFTGSEIGDLFVTGRKKDEMFGKTAMKYIYKKAAERCINPEILNDDDLFQIYLDQVNVHSKAMDWGTEQEENARPLYAKMKGYRVVEVGSIKHPTIPYFASSPDGFIYDEEKGEKACLEIKCLSQDNFMMYKTEIKEGQDLKEVDSKYYYQCQAHMACTGASWCDFVVYNPFIVPCIFIMRIYPDKEVFEGFETRIKAANEMIDNIIKG